MKKILILTLSLMALCSMAACQRPEPISISSFTSKNSFDTNSSTAHIAVMHDDAETTEENELLYIVNDVTDDEMDDYKTYTNVNIDDKGNFVLFAPAYKGSILKIYSLEENADGELEKRATLFEDSSTEKGMMLKAELTRSETPYMVYVEYDRHFTEYIFQNYPEELAGAKTELVIEQGEIPALSGAD